jgi:hypothetical protein
MKIIQKLAIALSLIFFSTSVSSAQDLSKYRNFSLGMRLADLSKQVNATPDEVVVIHQSPAVIQELTWWPVPSYQSTAPPEPIQEVVFSFYNAALYRIVVTYESSATEGLTAEDMVRAISAKYGAATVPIADPHPPVSTYGSPEVAIAFWQDSQNSLTLSRSPLSNAFELVMFSKQLNAQAEAATAEAIQQDREDAPQKEIARVKKEADDLEAQRQSNLKAFRP